MSNIGFAIHLPAPPRGPAIDARPALLTQIHEAGFRFVTWERSPACDPQQVRALLDDAGLKAVAGCDTLAHFEEDTGAALDFWAAIGAPDIALTGFDGAAPEGWPTHARLLAALARRFDAYQFRLAIDTAEAEALLAVRTTLGAESLCVQLDTGILEAAGVSAAETVRAFPDRCPVLRVGDLAEDGRMGLPLGEGRLDWEGIFDAAEEAAVEWYSCSIDLISGNAPQAAAASYAFLAEKA